MAVVQRHHQSFVLGQSSGEAVLRDPKKKEGARSFNVPAGDELPSIERLHTELGSDRFTVVLISQNRDWKLIGPYLKRLRVAGPESFRDDKLKFSRAMGVGSLPVSALVDHEGNVVGNLAGTAEWDTPEALALVRHYIERMPERAEGPPAGPQRVGTGFSPE